MAENLALTYSDVVDERFAMESRTSIAFNQDYDWIGVQTVRAYSVETAEITDYARTGNQRYGSPEELSDTVQELTLTQDKAFTYIVDRGNQIDQVYIKEIGSTLDRQLRERVVPYVDTYRLATLAANSGRTETLTLTNDNAYAAFLGGQEFMGDGKVPENGRVSFISYAYYKMLKLDPSFVQSGNSSEISLVRGVVGYVDGIPLIPVPRSFLPDGVHLILVHPVAAAAPVKLQQFVIHDNPPGINGWLVEGRIYFDTFVLANKVNGIYVVQSA